MEIPGNQINQLLEVGKSNVTIDKLQTGQTVYAKVVEQLPDKNQLIIRLGNQLLQAKSDVQVNVGQTLKVLVEKSAGNLTLKVPTPAQPVDLVNATLRQLLPKQAPINEFQQPLKAVLTSINKLSSSQSTSQQSLLTPHLTALKTLTPTLLQPLTNKESISSPNGLRTAIQNSGIFLESKLQQALNNAKAPLMITPDNGKPINKSVFSNQPLDSPILTKATQLAGSAVVGVDLKANLVRLIQVLKSWPKQIASTPQQTQTSQQQAPPLPLVKTQAPLLQTPGQTTPPPVIAQTLDNQLRDLISKTEGALSKITLNQLASTSPESSSARQNWQLEIPFFNNQTTESIFLKIEKEVIKKNRTQAEQQWTISLEMSPPKLGLIKNKLTLFENQLNSSFWAENSNTNTLIREHLGLLRERLSRANLNPDKIKVLTGPGPNLQDIKSSSSILSEKA
ncbi:MAG: flagellar hook-length control protein FliK [Cycloclasticus sp.]